MATEDVKPNQGPDVHGENVAAKAQKYRTIAPPKGG